MVLLVHGGPWTRDCWGFNPWAQWLANRGYACLQPNYRGSTGYGKAFLKAGFKEWGRAMQNDLVDAKKWAVAQGIAQSNGVGLFGRSFGGYAAVAGLAFTPEEFACAVAVAPPTCLEALVTSLPQSWKPIRALFDARIGNVSDPRDLHLMLAASPLLKADRIIRPLLIAQGGRDPRVKREDTDRLVVAIGRSGGRLTYVLYPDEGHEFETPANMIDFIARAEGFLAQNLGGGYEPATHRREAMASALVTEVNEKPS
jgi:dipeptidyl aminopeptidase/acylaminoacyl peptidase